MPLEMGLQRPFDPVEPRLNVLEVVLPYPAHLPPDKEQHGEHQDPDNVQDGLECQNGKPFSAAPSSSVFISSMGLVARKTGVLAPTVAARLASSILAAYPASFSLVMVS